MWNMSLEVQNELRRTNNDTEGWQNRFPGPFYQRHAHIWKFIEGLQNDSTLNHHSVTQIMAVAVIPPQRIYPAMSVFSCLLIIMLTTT